MSTETYDLNAEDIFEMIKHRQEIEKDFEMEWYKESSRWVFPSGEEHKELVKKAAYRLYLAGRLKAFNINEQQCVNSLESLEHIKPYIVGLGHYKAVKKFIESLLKRGL